MTQPPPGAPALADILRALALAPHQVQAFDPAYPAFDAQRPLLVLGAQIAGARPLVAERYPAATPVTVLDAGAVEVHRLEAAPRTPADAWLLPALGAHEDRRSLSGLRGVMEHLFGPDGCPWDREQTPETLRRFFLEECYELVDAIDRGDQAGLEEELGDVLAHVFMQTTLGQIAGAFSVESVAAHASEKFVRRHPHVFADEESGSSEALLDRWEAIKRAEREEGGERQAPGALDSVPAAAPALQRAQSLIARALRAGADEPAATPAERLRRAVARLETAPSEAAAGALLWEAVRLTRAHEIDAEQALREAARRFVAAFERVEGEARATGREIAALPAERRAAPWDAVPPVTP